MFLLLHVQYGSVAAKGTTQAGFPSIITSNVTLRLLCMCFSVTLILLYGSVAAKGTTQAGFPIITSNVTLLLLFSMLVLLHLLYGSVAAKGTTHGFPSIITSNVTNPYHLCACALGFFFFLAVAPMILAEGNSKE